MKRITLVFLFFCLALTTILAQVVTTNISAPNSSGLSSNSVGDFDVNSDGTILNNSAASGTATLGSTAVTANSNITAGSEASLILFQVTSTSNTSDLNGQIEVFGSEAGLIIANPNGIECNGCGFINTNRVDLVTGSGYNASTNIFDSIAASNIRVDSGGLDASSVAILNIQTGANFSNVNGATTNANNFNVTVGNHFYNQDSATINADNFNVTAGEDFLNSSNATISAEDSFNVTVGDVFYNRDSATINADNFNVTASGNFLNLSNATISAEDSFNATVDTFLNQTGTTINADNFNVTAGTNFINQFTSRINANNFNVTANFFINSSLINADSGTITSVYDSHIGFSSGMNSDSLTVMAGRDFKNRSTINVDNLNVTAGYNFDNDGTINANELNVTAGNNFQNQSQATINANELNVTAENDFINRPYARINANNFHVTAGGGNSNTEVIYFFNYATISADNVTIEVTSFADDISNSGTVTADSLNFILTNNFSHESNSFTGFTFNNLDISTDGAFTNNDTIDLDGNLTITANSFDNSGGVVSADTFSLSVAGDFDYTQRGTTNVTSLNLQVGGVFSYDDSSNDFTWRANVIALTVSGNANITALNFINHGSIDITGSGSSGSFEITTGYTAINQGSIASNSLDINADDFFRNLTGGDIDTRTLTITAGGKVTNTANINVTGTLPETVRLSFALQVKSLAESS